MHKIVKFRSHLAQKIKDGKKITTWRLFDDKDLQVGDTIDLINWESGEKFGEAEITDVKEKKLGEVDDSDYEGHETFESREEMMQTYRKYYGDKVDENSPLKIIKFKVLQFTN